jgi:hypothetical protein
MSGFGGQRSWNDVSTTLEPLLHHPDDDGPDLGPAQCSVLLPRLEEILDGWQERSADPLLQRHIEDTVQLVAVLHLCVNEDVDLIFC